MYFFVRFKALPVLAAAFLLLGLAAALIIDPQTGLNALKNSLSVCGTALIPALFPFLIIGDYGFGLICSAKRQRRGVAVFAAIALGLLGGFPLGSKALGRLAESGILEPKRASRLLSGCVNAGPGFLISAVGTGLFGSPRAGLLLFAALSAASLLCCLAALLLPCRESQRTWATTAPKSCSPPSFTASMSSSVTSMLNLCGYVLLFSCIIAYLNAFTLLFSDSPGVRWAVCALLEVSTACASAADIGSVSGLMLAGAAVSLCGASVILQARSATQKSGLSITWLLLSRPFHLAVTLGLLKILISIFPSAVGAFAGPATLEASSLTPFFSIFFILVAIIFILSERQASLFTKRKK